MKLIADEDSPKSMRAATVRERRKLMLGLSHVAPLTAYVAKLRQRGSVEVPDFDPLDGGIDARVLFLFEKPGPMTAESGKATGSGFISRNNDDPTAEATFHFMRQAELPREKIVIWNVIPWWNGTRKITKQELEDGIEAVRELIALLPELRAAVMVGKNAAGARSYLEGAGLTLFTSDHPSPLVRARWPERWAAISSEWAKVRRFIDD